MSIFSRDPENSTKIAQFLLNKESNPNLKNKDGWTPLHLAIRKSQHYAVNFAIDYNKELTLSKNNKNQTSRDKSIENKKISYSSYCK